MNALLAQRLRAWRGKETQVIAAARLNLKLTEYQQMEASGRITDKAMHMLRREGFYG